ncbi:MAG: hypothetical protein WCH44_13455, partial [Betaproteobacteria bacterium]
MGTAAFTQNTEVRIAGKGFLMLRKVTDDTWQLEETKTKRIHEKTDIELRSMYVDGILEFACAEELTNCKSKLTGKSNLEISEALMNDAKVRRAYALAANECPATKAAIEAVAKEVWVKLGKPAEVPHWTTVYRWKKRLIDAGRDIHAV